MQGEVFNFPLSDISGRGCKTVKKGDESYSESINIPKMKWTETPAVISKGKRK